MYNVYNLKLKSKWHDVFLFTFKNITFIQYIGGYKNLYIVLTLCFMLLVWAAIFRETTECRPGYWEGGGGNRGL